MVKKKKTKKRAIDTKSRKSKKVKRGAKKIKSLVHKKSKKYAIKKAKHKRYRRHLKTEKISLGKKKRYSPHFANRVRELDLYIHNSMHKNYSDEVIIRSLVNVGWPRQFVEKRLREIHGFEKKKISLDKERAIPKHLETKKKKGIFSSVLGRFHKPRKPKEHLQEEKKDSKIKIKFKKKETEAIRAIKSSLREKDEFKTDLDRLYNLLQEKKQIRISEIATGFNISKKQAEEWCRILEENELAVLHYPTIGEPVLKCK